MNDQAQQQVVRTLELADESASLRASELLRGLNGISKVEVEKQQLHITYDITRTNWSVICAALMNAGLYSRKGFIARWRDSWRDQLDQNMRDNLTHKAACCSKPPPGAK